MRPCRCADPENCTEPVPGMVCRGSRGHATNGEPPEILIGDVVMHFGPMEPPRFQQVTTEYERRRWAKPHDELQAVLRPVWRRVAPRPAPGAAPADCRWSEDEDGQWHTACGNLFHFDSDPPHDWMNFCCYCASPVALQPYQEPPIEDDDAATPAPPPVPEGTP